MAPGASCSCGLLNDYRVKFGFNEFRGHEKASYAGAHDRNLGTLPHVLLSIERFVECSLSSMGCGSALLKCP
eukprot:2612982-Prymnesium_polylepis.2